MPMLGAESGRPSQPTLVMSGSALGRRIGRKSGVKWRSAEGRIRTMSVGVC